MKLRPLGDRVVIKPVEREEKTKSGIVLPDTAKEKPQEGMVEAIGNGRFIETTGKREPLDVKVGDRVVYAKYSGSEIKLDEIEYLILSEKDILAAVANGKSSPPQIDGDPAFGLAFFIWQALGAGSSVAQASPRSSRRIAPGCASRSAGCASGHSRGSRARTVTGARRHAP